MSNKHLKRNIKIFIGICLVVVVIVSFPLHYWSQQIISKSTISHDSPNSNELYKLVRGKIGYNIPDTMKVGDQHTGTVTITKALNDSILFLEVDSSGFIIQEIMVSSKVEVDLIDPTSNKNFNIVALSSRDQLVDTISNTMWVWKIVPLESGQNDLLLRATVKVLSPFGETPKDIPLFVRKITVHASPILTLRKFFEVNWQWVAGTIFIPILLWLFQTGKRKKEKQTKIGF